MQDQSSPQPLRVGIVGLGWTGEQHLLAYKQIPGVEVMALAGLEQDKGRELCATYGVPELYSGYEQIIERADIDAVSVCVPNYLHSPIGLAALRASKHILVEKPLALNGDEAKAMVDAAAEAGKVIQVVFNQRRRDDAAVLKRHIDEGGLGRIYYAKAHWMRRSGIPGLGSWFTSKAMAGGGPLIDLGVHVLDLAMWLLGEPEVKSVSASTYAELGPRGRGGRTSGMVKFGQGSAAPYEVEDLATAFIRLKGGATLHLEASWATYSRFGDDFGVVLYGTEGGAEIDVKNYGWEQTLRIFNDVGGVPADIVPRVARGEGHLGVVRDFVDTVRTGQDPLRSGLEGLRRARIIDACYVSAEQGREIEFPEGTG
jgi:predicted dehydrogenase